jgi:hypothetical protein
LAAQQFSSIAEDFTAPIVIHAKQRILHRAVTTWPPRQRAPVLNSSTLLLADFNVSQG